MIRELFGVNMFRDQKKCSAKGLSNTNFITNKIRKLVTNVV